MRGSTAYGASRGVSPARAAALARPAARPAGGSASRVTSTSPTARPREHARQPVDVVGVEVGQHHQRDPGDAEAGRGSGPSAAGRDRRRRPPRCGAARCSATSPSPWPTSQATMQPAGRRPAGRRHPDQHGGHEDRAARPARCVRRRTSRGPPRPPRRSAPVSTARATGPLPHADRRRGQRRAPCAATATIQATHQPGASCRRAAQRGARPA